MTEVLMITVSFITVVCILVGAFTAVLSFIKTVRSTSNVSIVCLLVSSLLLLFVWLDFRADRAKEVVYEQVQTNTLKDSKEYKHWLINYKENK